jgi:hypothetical protein
MPAKNNCPLSAGTRVSPLLWVMDDVISRQIVGIIPSLRRKKGNLLHKVEVSFY